MRKTSIFATIWAFVFSLFLAPSFVYAQANLSELDKHFEEAQKNWGVPGMAVAILKDGEIVLAKGYGVLEEE